MNLDKIKFDEHGLVPAIVQDALTTKVLTLAYMNEESLSRTIETGETWFWSRSRAQLWHKGATSGNTQRVVSVTVDCDGDALRILVLPNGPACHTGEQSCFHNLIHESRTVRLCGRQGHWAAPECVAHLRRNQPLPKRRAACCPRLRLCAKVARANVTRTTFHRSRWCG